ncbi:MAG TPA: SDR family oxidoreductase [Terriglobales bacterium]|nr:SDR family oxidoreductase [Terriglobales bacterium]
MAEQRSALVVGGTSGLGGEVAQALAARGERVVVTGRDGARAQSAAAAFGARGLALDLTRPETIAASLAPLERVDHLVIAAIQRDDNTVRGYDIARATQLAVLKLVGYTEVIHALGPRLAPDAAIVLFGGLAKERPYPGSTTVTTVNGAVSSMIRTLAAELAPIRVNAIHPGIVGDSPAWKGKPPEVLERVRVRTPTGRLPAMADITGAVLFLLDNRSVNGVNLNLDGGWLLL